MTPTVTSDRVRGRGTALWRLLVRAGAVALGIGALWRSLFWVLAADRGLDLTDEGLYLLAARPPSIDAAWGTPFGWHTAPLFRMVGYDVAAFRTLGALLLVSAAGFLGVAAVRLGQDLRGSGADGAHGSGRLLERLLGGVMGGMGGLLYYGGLIRTPSYNWVTVLGATIAAVGLIHLVLAERCHLGLGQGGVSVSARDRGGDGAWRRTLGILLAGFGTFFTVPAKPTTPIFFAVLAGLVLWKVSGARSAMRTVISIAGVAMLLAAGAIAGGLWSTDVIGIFLRAVATPPLIDRQGLVGASVTFLRFPFDVVRDGRVFIALVVLVTVVMLTARSEQRPPFLIWLHRPWRTVGVVVAGALGYLGVREALGLGLRYVHSLRVDGWSGLVMANRGEIPLVDYVAFGERMLLIAALPFIGFAGGILIVTSRRSRMVTLIGVIAVILGGGRELAQLVLGEAATVQYVRARLTADAAVVLIGVVLASLLVRPKAPRTRSSWRTVQQEGPLAVGALFLLAVATGFGSGHGLMQQASLAAGIVIAALILAATAQPDRAARFVSFAIVISFLLPTSILHLISNRQSPYRMEPIVQQAVLTEVGQDGAALRLDIAMAAMLSDMVAGAEESGWLPGTPVLGVSSPWASTLPWHLGSRAPNTLMLTLGSYGSRSDALFDANLATSMNDDLRGAWIIVNGETHERRDESWDWAVRSALAAGRVFPDDYMQVFFTGASDQTEWITGSGDVELWRPQLP